MGRNAHLRARRTKALGGLSERTGLAVNTIQACEIDQRRPAPLAALGTVPEPSAIRPGPMTCTANKADLAFNMDAVVHLGLGAVGPPGGYPLRRSVGKQSRCTRLVQMKS